MATFYKATRPDGLDFYSGTIDYAGALASGEPVAVPAASRKLPAACCSPAVLHASDTPSETLIGGEWPCRLFEVTGRSVANEDDRGIRTLWATPYGPPAAQYEVQLWTAPRNWGVGVSLVRDAGTNQECPMYGGDPHRLEVSVELGPWEIAFSRTWGQHQ